MRIGINASGMLGNPDLSRLEAQMRTAAEQGFHSFWLAQATTIDALTVIAALGRDVPNIEFGTAVVPTYPRHPSMLAAQAMTAQAIVGGRLTLGVGLSHKVLIEGYYGMSFDKPIRHMREYLSILMPLVDAGSVDFEGETLTGHGAITMPAETKPCDVLVAALGSQMLRLAGHRTEGTVLWMVGEKTIASHIAPRIHDAAAKAGRPEPRIVASLPICVTEDEANIRNRADRAFAMYGQLPSYRAMLDREGAETPTDAGIFGNEAYVRDRLNAIAEAGATEFSAVEFCRTDDERENTRELLRSFL
ncbi:MAG: LLM class F420-dependent oxidoreductase [Myxococcota bacterium]|jgi:F420-dependent oxidoreductase-like protein|nr:LLM class F420-dependent oxidoreductase [Myxococcota bacterium]